MNKLRSGGPTYDVLTANGWLMDYIEECLESSYKSLLKVRSAVEYLNGADIVDHTIWLAKVSIVFLNYS